MFLFDILVFEFRVRFSDVLPERAVVHVDFLAARYFTDVHGSLLL
jgi:hypothetical protein